MIIRTNENDRTKIKIPTKNFKNLIMIGFEIQRVEILVLCLYP